MSADRPCYLDASAIVKLIVNEPESAALRRYLRRRHTVVSSALSRTEVMRAVLPLGDAALERARAVLARVELVRVSNEVLDTAGALHPPDLRSLDAIHLATARLFERSLGKLVTYDSRMAQVARELGLPVHAPA